MYRFIEDSRDRLIEKAKATGELEGIACPDSNGRLFFAMDEAEHDYLLVPTTSLVDRSRVAGFSFRDVKVFVQRFNSDEIPTADYIIIKFEGSVGRKSISPIAQSLSRVLAKNTMESGRAVETVLNEWRRYWGGAPEDRLSDTAALGLSCELFLFCEWMLPVFGPSLTVNAWVGSAENAYQDFQFEKLSVEVKSSRNLAKREHRINGVDQLNSRGLALYLCSVKARSTNLSQYSLNSWVERSKKLIEHEPDALAEFEDKLVSSGYLYRDFDFYENFCFQFDSPVLFHISDGFPKLSRQELSAQTASRIDELNYLLDLEGLDSYVVARSLDEFEEIARLK